jgi:conjugative transfer region protein TrbK
MRVFLRLRRASPHESLDTARLLLRAVALAVVAAAIALAVHLSRRVGAENADSPQANIVVDPLTAELARCRTISPEQNASDDTCRRIWAESRRRFFAPSSPRPNAAANDPVTAVPGKDQERLPSVDVQPNRGEVR